MRSPTIAAALLLAFLPFAAGQGATAPATTTVTYYLHAVGQCSGAGPELSMDQKDSTGDADGCGSIRPGAVVEPATLEYPGKDIVNASVAKDAEVKGEIYITTNNPASLKASMRVAIGKASCTSAEVEKTVTPAAYAKFDLTCKLDGAANATATPSLVLSIVASPTYFMGYEAAHTSKISFPAAPVPATASNNTTASPAGNDSPAPPLPFVAAGLVIAALIVERRRRLSP